MLGKSIKKWAGVALILIAIHSIAGVDRGGITYGVIEFVPEATVNETAIDSASTEFVANGIESKPDVIKEGRYVTLAIDEDDKGRYQLTYDDNVRGPIGWIDYSADSGIFTVLGQKVFLTNDTNIEASVQPQSIFGLSVGSYVEVSGYRDSSGDIYASYLSDAANSEFLEVTGIAENVDEDEQTLTIGDLIVDYSDAQFSGFNIDQPIDGNLIEVRGNALINDGEEIVALVLNRHPIITGEPGTQLVLEGKVSHLDVGDGTLRIDGTPAYFDNDTDFDNGGSGDLQEDGWLFIDGQFDDDGYLHLDKIEFIDAPDNAVSESGSSGDIGTPVYSPTVITGSQQQQLPPVKKAL